MRPYLHVTHTPETGALVVLTDGDGRRLHTFDEAVQEARRILAGHVWYYGWRRGRVRLVDVPGALVTGKILRQPKFEFGGDRVTYLWRDSGPLAVLQATLWLPR